MKLFLLAGLVLGPLAMTGCGSSETPTRDAASTPSGALTAYLDAARAGDEKRLFDFLSSGFTSRSNLTTAERRTQLVQVVRRETRHASDHVVFDEQLDEHLAVVAVSTTSRPGAFAAPLVLEHGAWKVEPYGLDLVYGETATAVMPAQRTDQIEFGVNAPIELKRQVRARLWIDGRPVPVSRAAGAPVNPTFAVNRPKLSGGRHTVVAFAQAGNRIATIAWTFRIDRD